MEGERKVKAIYVQSLEDYIKEINNNCLIDESYISGIDGNTIDMSQKLNLDDVWFRGEPNCYKYVLPSLFRDFCRANLENENYRKPFDYVADEIELIDKALQYYPQLFEHCNNTIEQLVTMQHYLLPTRLLDVTKNPLVALFLACQKGEKEDNGRVLFTNKPVCRNLKILDYLAELIVKVGIVNEYEDFSFRAFCKILEGNGSIHINDKKMLFQAFTDSILFIPKYNNDRIKHQQGAIIFSALVSVESNYQDKYNELNGMIFNESLGQEIKDKYFVNKMNAIKFRKTLRNLDDQFSNKLFVIPKEDKEKILEELYNYGINEAFVFPEPEHQMQYVKRYCINRKYKNH